MGRFNDFIVFLRKQKNKNKDLPSFFEDNFCQIEIISIKNINYTKSLIIENESFTKKNKVDNGFIDVIIRKNLPFSTLSLELNINNFESVLFENGLIKSKKYLKERNVRTDSSLYDINSFGLGGFDIIYDSEDEFIKNIWISSSLIVSTEQFNKILDSFYKLGKNYELVLINWNSLEIIDLSDKKQIIKYLMYYWK